MDEQGVGRFFGKADAVIADAEPQLAGVALQLLDVALACLRKTVESGEDTHGSVPIDLANVDSRRGSKDDLLHAGSRQRLESSAEEPNSATISS